MRYLKNQFRGRIGRTILEKKRQKSSPPLLFFDTAQTQCLCGVRDFIVVL